MYLGAQPLGNGLPGQLVAMLIPMAFPERFFEAMKKNLVLGGVILKEGRQQQDGNVVALTKLFHPAIRIEEVIDPQESGKSRPGSHIWVNLIAIAKNYDDKAGSPMVNFISHF